MVSDWEGESFLLHLDISALITDLYCQIDPIQGQTPFALYNSIAFLFFVIGPKPQPSVGVNKRPRLSAPE